MQWDATDGGGFTTGEPRLPLADHRTRNVEAQSQDPGSMLSLYRRLIRARRASPALERGTHRSLFGVGPDLLAYLRDADGERVLVLLNLVGEPRSCVLDPRRIGASTGEVLVATSTRAGSVDLADGPVLDANEGVVLRLSPAT